MQDGDVCIHRSFYAGFLYCIISAAGSDQAYWNSVARKSYSVTRRHRRELHIYRSVFDIVIYSLVYFFFGVIVAVGKVHFRCNFHHTSVGLLCHVLDTVALDGLPGHYCTWEDIRVRKGAVGFYFLYSGHERVLFCSFLRI